MLKGFWLSEYSEIYRQKLQQCVADGELSEEDVKTLLHLRVMLCIPQQTAEAAHASICGSLFEKVSPSSHYLYFNCLIDSPFVRLI